MKNIKFVYKLSVGLVIAVFLLIAISDMAGNYSKNYKVQIIGGELSSSDGFGRWGGVRHPIGKIQLTLYLSYLFGREGKNKYIEQKILH